MIAITEPHVIVERQGVRYTLIGTAHVSQKSTEAVIAAIASGQYDAVAVELCGERKTNLFAVPKIKTNFLSSLKQYGLYATIFLRSVGRLYETISKKIGVEAGSEFKAAISQSEQHSIPYALIDQDFKVTAKRVSNELGFLKLFGLYLSSWVVQWIISFQKRDDLVQMIEKMKMDKDNEKGLMAISSISQERDLYMVEQLKALPPYQNVLVVVGAKHLTGMAKLLATT